MPRTRRSKLGTRHSRRGFTLIEAALTTVIVGTGVLAIISAQQAYHRKNQWAVQSGTGLLLANEVRERMLGLPTHDPLSGSSNLGPESDEDGPAAFDDIDDFAGAIDAGGFGAGTTFDPPINALGESIPDMAGWSQHVEVLSVLPDRMNVTAALAQPLGSTDLFRVTVTTSYDPPGPAGPEVISELTWVMGRQ